MNSTLNLIFQPNSLKCQANLDDFSITIVQDNPKVHSCHTPQEIEVVPPLRRMKELHGTRSSSSGGRYRSNKNTNEKGTYFKRTKTASLYPSKQSDTLCRGADCSKRNLKSSDYTAFKSSSQLSFCNLRNEELIGKKSDTIIEPQDLYVTCHGSPVRVADKTIRDLFANSTLKQLTLSETYNKDRSPEQPNRKSSVSSDISNETSCLLDCGRQEVTTPAA